MSTRKTQAPKKATAPATGRRQNAKAKGKAATETARSLSTPGEWDPEEAAWRIQHTVSAPPSSSNSQTVSAPSFNPNSVSFDFDLEQFNAAPYEDLNFLSNSNVTGPLREQIYDPPPYPPPPSSYIGMPSPRLGNPSYVQPAPLWRTPSNPQGHEPPPHLVMGNASYFQFTPPLRSASYLQDHEQPSQAPHNDLPSSFPYYSMFKPISMQQPPGNYMPQMQHRALHTGSGSSQASTYVSSHPSSSSYRHQPVEITSLNDSQLVNLRISLSKPQFQTSGPAIDVATEHQSKNRRAMPSASSLQNRSQEVLSSQGTSSLARSHSWSASSSFVGRPSPYGSERFVRNVSRRPNGDLIQDRPEDIGPTKAGRMAIISAAQDDFKAASCLTSIWQDHCDERSRLAREALVAANRDAASNSLPTLLLNGKNKGKIAHSASTWRSSVKTKTRDQLHLWIDFPKPGTLIPEEYVKAIAKEVTNILFEDSFANVGYEGDPNSTHFGERLLMNHPAMITWIVHVFYSGSGIAAKRPVNFTSTYFPLAALATMIVIIKNAFSEWKSGKHNPIPLGPAETKEYVQWLKILKAMDLDSHYGPYLRETLSRIVSEGLIMLQKTGVSSVPPSTHTESAAAALGLSYIRFTQPTSAPGAAGESDSGAPVS